MNCVGAVKCFIAHFEIEQCHDIHFLKTKIPIGAFWSLFSNRKCRVEKRAEGRAEGRAEVAKTMMEKGMDVKIIASLTGLSEEEIKSLSKK